MHNLTHPDAGQIPVPLVGKYNQIRPNALDTGGHRRCAAMGCLLEVKGKIIIHQHSAAHRCDADGLAADAELVDDLRDESMGNPVGASRAIVRNCFGQGFGFLKCFSHFFSPI